MKKQSEAERLADLLEAVPFIGFVFNEQPGVEDPGLAKEAADELRRLHAENERLHLHIDDLCDRLEGSGARFEEWLTAVDTNKVTLRDAWRAAIAAASDETSR